MYGETKIDAENALALSQRLHINESKPTEGIGEQGYELAKEHVAWLTFRKAKMMQWGQPMTGEDLRQLGASAISLVQEAMGQNTPYLEALKLWDTMTPERRRQVLDAFELMFDAGNYVILDPRVKAETDTNDLAHHDNRRLTFRYAEGSSPDGIELHP